MVARPVGRRPRTRRRPAVPIFRTVVHTAGRSGALATDKSDTATRGLASRARVTDISASAAHRAGHEEAAPKDGFTMPTSAEE